ncbi:hypothetical protein AA700_0042 [Acidiphilium acidophilum DSM 700]|nr:hypothetical protein AA700_0042 [Acidiphilium acidophilum DSM 700]
MTGVGAVSTLESADNPAEIPAAAPLAIATQPAVCSADDPCAEVAALAVMARGSAMALTIRSAFDKRVVIGVSLWMLRW